MLSKILLIVVGLPWERKQKSFENRFENFLGEEIFATALSSATASPTYCTLKLRYYETNGLINSKKTWLQADARSCKRYFCWSAICF